MRDILKTPMNLPTESRIECSLENLVLLMDKKLSLDLRLSVYDHLDRCWHCKEAVYRIARQRDQALYGEHAVPSIKTCN